MSLKGAFLEGYGVIHRSKGKIIQPSPRKISSLSPYSVGHKTKPPQQFLISVFLCLSFKLSRKRI